VCSSTDRTPRRPLKDSACGPLSVQSRLRDARSPLQAEGRGRAKESEAYAHMYERV
jgi:hypothetical protein